MALERRQMSCPREALRLVVEADPARRRGQPLDEGPRTRSEPAEALGDGDHVIVDASYRERERRRYEERPVDDRVLEEPLRPVAAESGSSRTTYLHAVSLLFIVGPPRLRPFR